MSGPDPTVPARPDPPTPGTPGRNLWRTLLVPRLRRTHVVAALLCVALGFGVVAQVRQTQGDALSGLRQDDLVRLLDELTQRNAALAEEQDVLRGDLAELRSSSSSRQAAQEAARQQAEVQGILAGTLPVSGPGVLVQIADPGGDVRAHTLVTVLEELRTAGAEAIELSGQRLTAGSWISDDAVDGVVVDGVAISAPYEWRAIGDSGTLQVALEIPGGALASVRNAGGVVTLREEDEVQIHAVRELDAPRYAEPQPAQ